MNPNVRNLYVHFFAGHKIEMKPIIIAYGMCQERYEIDKGRLYGAEYNLKWQWDKLKY